MHVVVGGNGAAGSIVCTELLAAGHTVRGVSRSGKGIPAGVEAVAADATDTAKMIEICAGADVVYHCALPPMPQWLPAYIDIASALVTAAGKAGARLVYADDTWMYGRVDGPMREDTPTRPVVYKGVLRALAAEVIMSAHTRGQTETVIGRAPELFGPRVESLLGSNLFAAALNGRTARWPGDPDLPMTACFIGDFGRGLADLGQHPDAAGRVFHVPVPPTISGRKFIEMICEQVDTTPKVGRITPRMVSALKLFVPIVREGAELLYQFEQPFLVDDSHIRELTGRVSTSWDDAIGQTVAWYRADPARAKYRLIPGRS
jgi:nucleoside-diphosphate-sugar epimerase